MRILLIFMLAACGPGIRHVDGEPDRNTADQCFAWCDWNLQRCSNDCTAKHQDPSQCISTRCEHDADPDIGKLACDNRCGSRFGALQNMPTRMR